MKVIGVGEYIGNAIAFFLMLFLSCVVYKKTKVI